jgi:hypothetical protein
VLGALLVSMLTAAGRALGVEVGFEAMLGSMVTGMLGPASWLIGFAMHLLAGGVFGVVYATVLCRAGTVVDAGAGAAVGISHSLVAGLALLGAPAVHPAMPQPIPAPGAFMAAVGWPEVAMFVVAHLAYGVMVGTFGERHEWEQQAGAALP